MQRQSRQRVFEQRIVRPRVGVAVLPLVQVILHKQVAEMRACHERIPLPHKVGAHFQPLHWFHDWFIHHAH